MEGMQEERPFEPLPMRRRKMEPVAANMYRIVSHAGEIRQVNAVTAYEAFRQSGFKQALKIERMAIFEKEIIENNKFIDELSFRFKEVMAEVTSEKEDPYLAIKRRTIVSADELDSLIRSIQEIALAKDESNKLVAAPEPVMQTFGEGLMLSEALVPGPAGMEVHGDGFDEIIPGTPAAAHKHAGVKATEAMEIASAEPVPSVEPQSAPAPQHELSQDEIEKLLSGSPPPAPE